MFYHKIGIIKTFQYYKSQSLCWRKLPTLLLKPSIHFSHLMFLQKCFVKKSIIKNLSALLMMTNLSQTDTKRPEFAREIVIFGTAFYLWRIKMIFGIQVQLLLLISIMHQVYTGEYISRVNKYENNFEIPTALLHTYYLYYLFPHKLL